MMKASRLAAAVLLLCGLAHAQQNLNYQVMPEVSTFAEAVQGCQNIGGKLAGETNAEQQLVLSIARDMNMDFWVNAEPSLRVFGRCKSANREGSLVARMCNSPTPVSFVCIVDSATAGSTARALSPTDRLYETIAERFEEWNRRLVAGGVRNFENDENECRRQYGDGSEIVQLYADDASLLATLSDKMRTGHEQIQDYFDATFSCANRDNLPENIRGQDTSFSSFLANNPVGRVIERNIQSVGPDTAVDQATTAFEYGPMDGRLIAYVRKTFVYKRINGEWKIKVHHSSQAPQYQSDDGLVKSHLQRWFSALYSQTCGPTERIVSEVTETDENGHSKTTVTREPIEPNCVDDIETRAHAVASLYAPDGVLLATVSPLIRVGRANIVDYMRYFLDLDPEGEVLKLANGEDDAEVKFLTPTSASYVGHYKFRINSARNEGGRTFSEQQIADGAVNDINGNACTPETCDADIMARFSYTYTRNGAGQWLISEHHSSAMPLWDGASPQERSRVRNGKFIQAPLTAPRHFTPVDSVPF